MKYAFCEPKSKRECPSLENKHIQKKEDIKQEAYFAILKYRQPSENKSEMYKKKYPKSQQNQQIIALSNNKHITTPTSWLISGYLGLLELLRYHR